ncbi:putative hydrolase of the HAD superfamily [Actinopolyspora lacussalsi subsp. righensis]|uniref:Putative hydrolase of the HAD superfamily n=1 Tax=Actinopolyspora righensis TaxID=995060 RepID=A0A1I7C708_9ACTN|nr:HAD family hydrolase [Actinopolyspora righensis]SFT95209.1 putative hydrolase of the HAD superfamily [Actinopolyspora righensis]
MKSALEVSASERPRGIRAVCLDIDDTLLDSRGSARRAFASLTGNDAAWPVWRRITDEYNARMMAGEIDFETMCRSRTRDFFAAFGERLSEDEVLAREHRRMVALRDSWELFEDATGCLEWLRASGLRVAAITNAPGGYQRHKLAVTGLAATFDATVISGECGVAKPSSGIFAAACDALGLSPAEVAHVGNNLEIDANGAACAGMHGIWLDRDSGGSTSAVVPADGVSVITSLYELPEVLVCDLPFRGADDELPACQASMAGSA